MSDSFTAEQVLAAPEVRCRAALSHSLTLVGAALPWSSWVELPGLTSVGRLVQQRLADRKRRKASLKPLAQLETLMRDRFPELEPQLRTPQSVRFTCRINDDVQLAVVWTVDQQFGLGQFLRLGVGLRESNFRWPYDPPDLVRPLSHYFSQGDPTCWVAESKPDLELVWPAAADFLDPVLALLRDSVSTSLARFEALPVQGSVSARSACELLDARAKRWSPQATLTEVQSTLFAADRWGWPLAADGTLRPHGVWNLQYFDPESQRHADASVPYVGACEFRSYVDPHPAGNSLSLGETWMDSPAAVQAAVERGGLPDDYRLSAAALKGQAGQLAPAWQISFGPPGDLQHGTTISVQA